MSTRPFAPYAHGTSGTTVVAASTTTAAGTLPTMQSNGCDLRIHNRTSSIAHVRWQNAASPTATTDDMSIPAGGVEVFEANGARYVAVILASGTGNVEFTVGRGI